MLTAPKSSLIFFDILHAKIKLEKHLKEIPLLSFKSLPTSDDLPFTYFVKSFLNRNHSNGIIISGIDADNNFYRNSQAQMG